MKDSVTHTGKTPVTYEEALAEVEAIGPRLFLATWQPIETAPKDGTKILITNGTMVAAVRWVKYKYRDDWEDDVSGGEYEVSCPTHWMPLPEPPK